MYKRGTFSSRNFILTKKTTNAVILSSMAIRIELVLFVLVLIFCLQILVEARPPRRRNNRRSRPVKGDVKVFSVQGCDGSRTLNYGDAIAECKLRYGANIANYMQLFHAWQQGYQKCAPGWLSMATVSYPVQRGRKRCSRRGPRYAGLVSLGFRDLAENYDVFCYPSDRNVYFVESCNGTNSLTYEEAVAECERQGTSIATYDQLLEEWQSGFQYCKAGWLDGGRVGFPSQDQSEGCGDEPGVVDLGTPDRSEEYGVFCYRSDDWKNTKWSLSSI